MSYYSKDFVYIEQRKHDMINKVTMMSSKRLGAWHGFNWRKVAQGVFIFLSMAMILYLVAFGGSVRPFQDDFYYYLPANSEELTVLLNERYHWTGRFTTTTVHLLVGWSGLHWIVPLVSFGAMIMGVYAISNCLLRRFTSIVLSECRLLSITIATGITLAIFLVTPSPYSSIFWLSGAPIHFWSYGLILLYCTYVLKRLLDSKYVFRTIDHIFMLIATAIIGMLGEVAMFTLAALVFLAALYAAVYKSKRVGMILVANVAGLIIACYALFFSLGAVIRRGSEGTVPVGELMSHAPGVIATNFHALVTTLLSNKSVLVIILLMACVLGFYIVQRIQKVKRIFVYAGVLSVTGFGLMCLNFVGVYSSVRLETAWSRTQAFSVIVIVGLIVLYGVIIGALIRQCISKDRNTSRWLGVVVFIGVLFIAASDQFYLPYIGAFSASVRERSIAYDLREQQIEQLKHQKDIVCPIQLPATHIAGTQEGMDLTPDSSHALNVGIQRYYHLPCAVVERQ